MSFRGGRPPPPPPLQKTQLSDSSLPCSSSSSVGDASSTSSPHQTSSTSSDDSVRLPGLQTLSLEPSYSTSSVNLIHVSRSVSPSVPPSSPLSTSSPTDSSVCVSPLWITPSSTSLSSTCTALVSTTCTPVVSSPSCTSVISTSASSDPSSSTTIIFSSGSSRSLTNGMSVFMGASTDALPPPFRTQNGPHAMERLSAPLSPPPSLKLLQTDFAYFALQWRNCMQWETTMITNLESTLESYHQLNRNALCLFEVLEQLQERENGYDFEHYNYLTGVHDDVSINSDEVAWMILKRPVVIESRAINFADETTAKQLLSFVRSNPAILGLLAVIPILPANEELILRTVGCSIFGRDKDLLCIGLSKMVSMSVRNDVKFLEDLGSATPKSFCCKLLQFCVKRACFDILTFFTEKLDHFICLGESLAANADEQSNFRNSTADMLRDSFIQPRGSEKKTEAKRSFRSLFFKKGDTPLRTRTNSTPDIEELSRVPQWRKSLICHACDGMLSTIKEIETAWPAFVFQALKVLFDVGTKQRQDPIIRRLIVRALLFDSFLVPALTHPERSGALTGRRLLPREQANLAVIGEVLACIFLSACGVTKTVSLEAPPNVRDAMDGYVISKQKEACQIMDRIIERTQQFTPKRKIKAELFFTVEMPWQELKALDCELRRGLRELEKSSNNVSPGNLVRSLKLMPSASYPEEITESKASPDKPNTSSKPADRRRATTVVREPPRKSLKPTSRKYTIFKLTPPPSPSVQDLDSFLKRFFLDQNSTPTSTCTPAANSSRVRFNFVSSHKLSLDLQPLVRLFCNPLWCERNFQFDDIRSIIMHTFQPLSSSHTSDKTWLNTMTISALLQNLRSQDLQNVESNTLRGALQECLIELKKSFDVAWHARRDELQEAIQETKHEMERLTTNISRLRDVFLHRRVLKLCGELEVPLKLQLPAAFSGQDLMLEFTNVSSFARSYRAHHHDFLQQKNRTYASAVFQAFSEAAQSALSKRAQECSSDSSLVLEKYISLDLFSSMFTAGSSPDYPSERDEKLMSKIRELSWLTPAALGLPTAVIDASPNGVAPWAIEPVLQLRRLELLWSPSEKLLCLSRVAKSIVLHLQLICDISTIDADTFLGALILVIVQASPVRILANLDYIKTFGPQPMTGEATYCCNQFDIAIAYIKKTSSIPARVPIATSTVVFSYPNFLFGLLSCLPTNQCLALMLVCSRIHLVIHREPRLFCVCFPTEPTLIRPLTLQHPLLSPHGRMVQLPAPKAVAIRVKLHNLPRSFHANVRYFVALYSTEQHCPFSFQYASQTSATILDPNRISNLHLVYYPTSPDPLIKLVVIGVDTFSEFVVGQATCKMVRVIGRGFVEQALMGPEEMLDSVKSVGTICIEVSPPDEHPPVSSALPEQIQANVSVWFKHVEDFLTVSKDMARVQVHGSAHSAIGPLGEGSNTEIATLTKPVPRRLRFERPMYFDQATMVRKPPPVVEVDLLVKNIANKEVKTPADKPVDSIATASLNGPRDLCAHWGIWQAYDMKVLHGESYKKHLLLKPHFTGTICLSIAIQNLRTPGAFVAARQAGLFVCQTEPVMDASPRFSVPLLVRLDRQPSLGPLTQHSVRPPSHSTGMGLSTRLRPPFVDLYVFSPVLSVTDLQADWIGFVQISLPDALARILSMGSLEMNCPIITLDKAGNPVTSTASMQCVLSCSVDTK